MLFNVLCETNCEVLNLITKYNLSPFYDFPDIHIVPSFERETVQRIFHVYNQAQKHHVTIGWKSFQNSASFLDHHFYAFFCTSFFSHFYFNLYPLPLTEVTVLPSWPWGS
jgi:hypothetical protein